MVASLISWCIIVFVFSAQQRVWSPQVSISWLHSPMILSSLDHSSKQYLRLRFIWKFSFSCLFLECRLIMSSKDLPVIFCSIFHSFFLVTSSVNVLDRKNSVCYFVFGPFVAGVRGRLVNGGNQTYLPRLHHWYRSLQYHRHIHRKNKKGRSETSSSRYKRMWYVLATLPGPRCVPHKIPGRYIQCISSCSILV